MKNLLLIACICLLSGASLLAQDKIKIELKDEPTPDVYIDGKKYDSDVFDLLDPNKIASVNVIKGEKAMKEYKAPNGVVLITTKKAEKESLEGKQEVKEIKITSDKSKEEPLIVINGNVSDRKTLSKLKPKDIEKIEVLKGEAAMEEYKAPNGVVIVTTKN